MTLHLRLALAITILITLAAAPVTAADLTDYRARLEAAREALRGDADVKTALSELRTIEPVTLDDGTTVTPDLSLVVAALEAEPPDVTEALVGIDAVLTALDLAQRGAATDPNAARAELDDVLARDEFQPEPEDDDSSSLWEYFLEGVNSVVSTIFEWIDDVLGGSGGGGSPASYALGAIGLLTVVGIVAFAVRGVRQSMTPGVTRLAEGRTEEHYSSAEARAEAERLFAAGEYRAALRLLYLATLIRWEEAGRLRFDRSLTNREVVARVSRQGDAGLLEQLSPLVDRFDRVWYGGAPCTSDDYTTFASLAERAWEVA